MQTIQVFDINDGGSDYEYLFRLAGDVAKANYRVRFEFTYCRFLQQNAVAFLGGLTRLAAHQGGQLEFAWDTMQSAVSMNLAQNGFMQACGGTRSGWEGNSIPFLAHPGCDTHGFGLYLKERWLGRGWINISPGLADAIAGNLSEVYVNAFEHAASPIGVFCCGQHYPKLKELKLTLIDFGVGIPAKVRKYTETSTVAKLWTPASCMAWAFQSGTSTKPADQPGPRGLGLDLLQAFVRKNAGRLEMFSHEGHALITKDDVQFTECASFFTGTLVTISLVCDETYYCLKSELPGPAPF